MKTNNDQATEKIDEIKTMLEKQKSDFNEFDTKLMHDIRQLENGAEKTRLNDLRNRIHAAMKRKDKDAIYKIIKELKK